MEGLLSPVHMVIIMVIVLILFGPGKLPELGKGLGKGIREFKDAIRGGIDGSSAPPLAGPEADDPGHCHTSTLR